MTPAVLLTTHNRPRLLAQSLWMIEREAEIIGAPIVIADDGSTDAATLLILDTGYMFHKATLVRHVLPPDQREAKPGRRVTLNWIFGFQTVLELYPDTTHIFKCDDDIVLSLGAFSHLRDLWSYVIRSKGGTGWEPAPDMMSGMLARRNKVRHEYDTHVAVEAGPMPCSVWSRQVVDALLEAADHPADERLKIGIEPYLKRVLLPERFGEWLWITPVEAVALHVGLRGVNAKCRALSEINVGKFAGNMDGIVTG